MKVHVSAFGHMEEHPDDRFSISCSVSHVSDDDDYVEIFRKAIVDLMARYSYFFDLEEITLHFSDDEKL